MLDVGSIVRFRRDLEVRYYDGIHCTKEMCLYAGQEAEIEHYDDFDDTFTVVDNPYWWSKDMIESVSVASLKECNEKTLMELVYQTT